jgi:nitroimidazol reductase NimA-like FMN-containing flavoprotein (pyridoxamine 5'-phosphate oxidase superfamily)
MDSMTYVDDLTPEVCHQLLGSARVGRVSFVDEDGYPVIMPVNYRMHDGRIVVRTNAGTLLEQMPRHRVSFQVDEVSPDSRRGWSVLARGTAVDLDLASDSAVSVDTWVPGEKEHWLSIVIADVTGRQIVNPTGA